MNFGAPQSPPLVELDFMSDPTYIVIKRRKRHGYREPCIYDSVTDMINQRRQKTPAICGSLIEPADKFDCPFRAAQRAVEIDGIVIVAG